MRVDVQGEMADMTRDDLLYSFEDISSNSASLVLAGGNFEVPVEIDHAMTTVGAANAEFSWKPAYYAGEYFVMDSKTSNRPTNGGCLRFR